MDIRSEVADYHTNVQTIIHDRYDIMIMKSNATTNLSFRDMILLVGTNQICAQAFKMKKKKSRKEKKKELQRNWLTDMLIQRVRVHISFH